jgi:hypothetical protein
MHVQDWQVGENQLQSSCGPASWEGRSRLARAGEARIETPLMPADYVARRRRLARAGEARIETC